jgi:hypothetical protein
VTRGNLLLTAATVAPATSCRSSEDGPSSRSLDKPGSACQSTGDALTPVPRRLRCDDREQRKQSIAVVRSSRPATANADAATERLLASAQQAPQVKTTEITSIRSACDAGCG